MTDTVLDRVVASLQAAGSYNSNAQVAPVALLWPDEGAQWQPVIDRISEKLPIVALGEYIPARGQGPAYWIRCILAGTLDAGLPEGTPIVYLPRVPRSELRAVKGCPSELAPIAELQYRSQWFSHRNGRDWTVRALLSHPDGLGLHITDDAETNAALLLALDRLLDEPIDRLAKQVIDADFCNQLVNPDLISMLLGWIDDPVMYRGRLSESEWATFVRQCKADYGFSPAVHGEVSAARRLGAREGKWAHVWARFADVPERYPGILEQLRKARPDQLWVDNADSWPQDNGNAEDQLRAQLLDFSAVTPAGARTEVARLEAEHAGRRATVWAKLDLAPLAFALEQLAALAAMTEKSLATVDLMSLSSDYTERGWRVDDAVLRALAAAHTPADRAAVAAAAEAIYRPWMNEGAKALQAIVGPMANTHTYDATGQVPTSKGHVILFVDGLRLDIAHRVRERLDTVGLQTDLATTLAALPTVTQTAKAALVPVANGSLAPGPELAPSNAETGTTATIQVLRALMSDNDVQVLGATQIGDTAGTAWAEAGEVDHRGHDMGARIVDFLDAEVDRIVTRARELLDGGWKQVHIVTDHGWLLLPRGLDKVDLPATAAVAKKGRCARLKDDSVVTIPTVPWYWDHDVRIAVAPGAACFEAGKEYEHGGVSPQECIVPRLAVSAGMSKPTVGGPEIKKIKWLGLLCRIELAGNGRRIVADIRALAGDPSTSIAESAEETASATKVSMLVPDETHEGERAYVVLVDSGGQILAQREVVVGSNR